MKSLDSHDQIVVSLRGCRIEHIFGIYSAYIEHILGEGGEQVEEMDLGQARRNSAEK